jgi:hypothetical protein
MLTVSDVIGLIGKGRGAKFANITARIKKDRSLRRTNVILGADTSKLYERDIEVLTAMLPTLTGARKTAAEELLASRRKSLAEGITGHDDTYVPVHGIPGVKVHRETGVVYVSCLVVSEEILEEGDPIPPVRHRNPVTAAKADLRYDLPSGRYRYIIVKNIDRVACNGDVLDIHSGD